jgi:hypothetical protein
MDDHELQQILRDIGRDRMQPPESLLRRTKAAIHGTRYLPLTVFLSLAMQVLAGMAVMYLLVSPAVAREVKIYAVCSLLALSGIPLLVTVAARRRITRFFRRMEQLAH